MKHIILSILFFLFVGGCFFPTEKLAELSTFSSEMVCPEETITASETAEDKIISVLTAANREASLSSRPSNSSFSHQARRQRNVNHSWEKLCRAILTENSSIQQIKLKSRYSVSEEEEARQKHAGYYIYSLCKIII